jgi:hypothetical protein
MSSGSDIQNQLTKVVNEAAKKLDLKKYSLNLDLNVLKGDGFLGEFYKANYR